MRALGRWIVAGSIGLALVRCASFGATDTMTPDGDGAAPDSPARVVDGDVDGDGGSDVGCSAAQAVIACGSTPCNAATESCCMSTQDAATVTCVQGQPTSCSVDGGQGAVLSCDDPSDCVAQCDEPDADYVCCLNFNSPVSSYGQSACVPRANCGAGEYIMCDRRKAGQCEKGSCQIGITVPLSAYSICQ
jgi:hypothetical protein